MHPPTHRRRSSRIGLPCGVALLALSAALNGGCSPKPKTESGKLKVSDEMQLEADKEFVREPFQDQVAQGVIRQRTIFDWQFEQGSAALTPLGKRDVRILAAAMRDNGGTVSVRQGAAPADLYTARRDTVRKALMAEGIASDRIRLEDVGPGGTGVGTVEALQIRERIQQNPMRPPPKDILSPTGGSSGGK